MSRTTAIASAMSSSLCLAAIALSAVASPAAAEAVVYEQQTVTAREPGEPARGAETATLDVPTGYERHRLSWHAVGFAEMFDGGRSLVLDLQPQSDTLAELKQERATFAEEAGDSYRELDFTVNDRDAKVRARWLFTYAEDGTGDVDPYISVLLMRGNRLQMSGRLSERKHVNEIRHHVVRSVRFGG